MPLGLEQAVAEFISATLPQVRAGTYGLYTDATLLNRIVWVGEIPEVPENPAEAEFPDLTITVFTDSGPSPDGVIREDHTITIQVRHQSYETAMEVARAVFRLLHELGGSNGANPYTAGASAFNGIRVWRITADFPPIRLGRIQDGDRGRFATSQSFTVRTAGLFDLT